METRNLRTVTVLLGLTMALAGHCGFANADSRLLQSAFIDPDGKTIPLASVTLLLPDHNGPLGTAADALRAGFFAAYTHDPSGLAIQAIETTDTGADMLNAYKQASANSDIIVGPLSRAGVTAIIQQASILRPTISLTQPDGVGDADAILPANVLPIGLSLESEARQVARSNADSYGNSLALVVTVSGAGWQQRIAEAYMNEARKSGLNAQIVTLNNQNGVLDPVMLGQLQERVRIEAPATVFAALNAIQATQLRNALGPTVPMFGTSQLNTQAPDARNAIGLQKSLEGVAVLDLPWMTQPNAAVVRSYARAPISGDRVRNPDLERLYALGIDAYRIAHETALRRTSYELNGVTGRLQVQFTPGATVFNRQEPWAIFRDGVATPAP